MLVINKLNKSIHSVSINNLMLLFLFLLFSYQIIEAQERLYCDYCGKVITGKYLRVDNHLFHPEHFICSACGKQITEDYYKENNKYYHQDCQIAKEGLYCAFCKKPLSGEWVVFEHKKYHESCYENFVAPRCAICNKPLNGIFNIDIYGNRYHKEHSAQLNKCDCCGRLICEVLTGGGVKYSDGRNICNLCRKNAVFDQNQFREILDIVSSRIASFGIKLDMKRISIVGVDKKFLIDKFKTSGEAGEGYCDSQTRTEYENNKLITKSVTHLIYLLNGVPKIAVESTVAHELMHVWIIENTKANHSDNIREGSCNYVSYLFLNSLNDHAKNDQIKIIEKNSDPVYGEGFQYIKGMFENKPVADFLRYLKN